MVSSKCFVYGCKTGYDSDRKKRKAEGKRKLSLFLPPRDMEMLQKWRRAIPRADKELSNKDAVCELHFLPEEISRHYQHVMKDGSEVFLEKGKPSLLPNAIPSLFPDLPSYLSRKNRKRKSPVKRLTFLKKQKMADIPSGIDVAETDHRPIHILVENLCDVHKPNKFWSVSSHEDFIICVKWDINFAPERQIIIYADLGIKIKYYGKESSAELDLVVDSIESLSKLILQVDQYLPCSGAKKGNENCSVFMKREWGTCGRPQKWCFGCKKQKLKPQNVMKTKKNLAVKYKKLYSRIASSNKKNERLRQKIALLKNNIDLVKRECSLQDRKSILQRIAHLPEIQRLNIEACLTASKVKSMKGMRYDNRWVYECLLMRIKSRRLYEHLRENKILAVPSVKTLGNYLKHVKGCFGFQSQIFDCLKKKATFMDSSDRRGVLLIDEMQLSPSLAFDKKTLKINGFTNLGEYTPEHQASQKGDHALVLMYQPFKGKWIQSIACFLSKGAASGTILHHIAVEAVLLLENSGFFVDVVTTDGAAWNRKMWSEFGISENNVSCAHVCDPERRLWFISDFPHLIKNIRNFITDKKFILTPDGPVKTSFWQAVIEHDNPRSHSLKICPRLKPDHVSPKFFQKMNVGMAFQFFSDSVASGMQLLKSTVPALEESDGCISFIRRMNKLIDAMNSRTPCDALKPNSLADQEIREFLEYITEWEKLADSTQTNFMTPNTSSGLKVTLTATLEILSYLVQNHNFKFLMTARLNQDSLEKFFGIMRSACGGNDHPDPTIFLQLYRLIGTYSLIKPPKGGNVERVEMFESLLKCTEGSTDDPDEKMSQIIDKILSRGGDPEEVGEKNDHIYNFISSSDMVVSYVTGFVARRLGDTTKCQLCKESLINNSDSSINNRDKLINIKSRGYLLKPSDSLFSLISQIEECVLETLTNEPLGIDTLNSILLNLEKKQLPLIGCAEHKLKFSNTAVKYYIVLRMCFICRQENDIDKDKKQIRKQHRKLSKL